MDTKKPSKQPAKKPTAAKAKQGPRPPGGAARSTAAAPTAPAPRSLLLKFYR